jgi:hypothetical protein
MRQNTRFLINRNIDQIPQEFILVDVITSVERATIELSTETEQHPMTGKEPKL